jgi:hypothetical protein
MSLLTDAYKMLDDDLYPQQNGNQINQNTSEIFNPYDASVQGSNAHSHQQPAGETKPKLKVLTVPKVNKPQQSMQQSTQPTKENFDDYEQRLDNKLNELRSLNSNGTLMDVYMAKKKDLYKLLKYVLIVVIAISFNKVMEDYLIDEVINELDVSYSTKFMVRMAYPFVLVLLLWSLLLT